MSDDTVAVPTEDRTVYLKLPKKLGMLFEMHPFKVAYGGRSSLKSWSFSRALLTLGIEQELRVLCAREVQKSIADSVHQLLRDQIITLGYEDLYTVTDHAIRGGKNGNTLFRFTGLSDQTADSIKSFEGFDVAWIEEAQSVTRRSWQILLPTIFRVKNSEVWVSFNPGMDTDETWQRFVVNQPEGAVVVEMNWRDAKRAGWMTDEQERQRQYDMRYFPEDYENIWEGRPRTTVVGAIYAREVNEMIIERRFRPVPYDPRHLVHRIWDLGWNDLMTVVMIQKPHPSAINIVNYIEDAQITYAEMIQTMDNLRYRWGVDWLPHDAVQHHPTSGTNAEKMIRELTGRSPRIIPRSDPEARIRAARMMFPRIYMDDGKRDVPPDRPERLLGAAHLMDRLKRYRRHIPKTTGEPAEPEHDAASHGADAFGGLAEIVERIRDESYEFMPEVPRFRNKDAGMGMLA